MATNADDIMLGRLDRLLSKTNIEKKMWVNRDFVFGDYFTNNQEFRKKVLDFYSQGDRKEDLFNKIARLDNYSTDEFYFRTHGNAFEAYKELEGLDTAGMQKKVVGKLKSIGYTEKDLRHHVELLQEGADHINWQGSRDFIDYDLNLYNNVNNVEQQAASRQRRRGNRNHRTHTAPNDPQPTGPVGPKIGDNFLNKNGDQVVIADIYDNWNGTNYAMVNQNGKRLEESFLDDYTPYKGDKPIDAKIAKDFSDKWSELRNLKDEFMDFRRKNPSWSAQERLDWIKEKVDPVVKSLNDYNSNMNKYLGTRRVFDKHDYNTYIRDFAKDQKKFARAEIKQQQAQQTQQTQNNQNSNNQTQQTQQQQQTQQHAQQQQTRQTQQTQQTRQTQNNQNRTRINREASAWTDEDIRTMADGDPDAYNDLIRKREKAIKRKKIEEAQRQRKEHLDRKNSKNVRADKQVDIDEMLDNINGRSFGDTYSKSGRQARKYARTAGAAAINKPNSFDVSQIHTPNSSRSDYENLWHTLLNERDAGINNEEAINNLFNINPNNTGTSYSYNIPDINQKEVDSFIERVFGSKDFDLRKASQNDINYWSNFTAQDIKDIYIFPSDFSNQDTLDEIHRRIDEIGEVSEAYKLTDNFMENNFGSKDFDITKDKDPSAWANLTDDDLEYAYESLLPDDNKSAREMILERLKTIRDDAQNLVNNQASNFNSGANFNQTNSNTNNYSNNNSSNTNTNTNTSGGGSSSANSGSGGTSGGGTSSGSGGSSNSTGGSSSSTKTHLYKRNGKMRQLSHGSSKYSANTKLKVNTNSGHLPRTSNKAVKTIGTMSALNTVFNVAGAVSDYKNARREGKGVVGATLKAGAEFALGEMLGLKGQLALFAVRAIPSAAIAGADMLYKESRRMNSAANQGVFGNAQFQDTQQLATMRQSGMEMAKMANYNLQQTLMGNEATYFHR